MVGASLIGSRWTGDLTLDQLDSTSRVAKPAEHRNCLVHPGGGGKELLGRASDEQLNIEGWGSGSDGCALPTAGAVGYKYFVGLEIPTRLA